MTINPDPSPLCGPMAAHVLLPWIRRVFGITKKLDHASCQMLNQRS